MPGFLTRLQLRTWILLLAGIFGILVGLGAYTVNYAEGLSYLSNDPEACVNCHVMREQYESWNHSSHQEVATCNDCHVRHTFPEKYIDKSRNGWHHSVAFTLETYEDNILIKDYNADIVQQNCEECHETIVSQIQGIHDEDIRCTTCHADVGHRKK
ncbi:MAG: cytochrome c nitrite reductase small subunit [Anaerolineae bacterium]|nr:cytochrome c nitrite reductase small subunit [Anaerolineae bacterium]